MGRKRHKYKKKEAGDGIKNTVQDERHQEPAIRLHSVHPKRPIAAVAVGTSVRICDYTTGEQFTLGAADKACHSAPLRALQFSPDGKFVLTGADDKTTKLWSADTWKLLRTWKTPKKVSACAFTHDGAYAMFADRFGDVLAGPTNCASIEGLDPHVAQSPATMLGHFCAIITSLTLSPDGKLMASCDKDFKVRITHTPANPTRGACNIQTYCMGHNEFVAAGAFVPQPEGSTPQYMFVSGSGDGSVKLWDAQSGAQLHSCEVSAPDQPEAVAGTNPTAPVINPSTTSPSQPACMEVDGADAGTSCTAEGGEEAGAAAAGDADQAAVEEGGSDGDDAGGSEGDEEGGAGGEAGAEGGDDGDGEPGRQRKGPSCAPVISVAVSPSGQHVAVVVEGEDEVQILSVQRPASGPCLAPMQRLRLTAVRYPCGVRYDAAGQLWLLGGVPDPTARSLHLGVAALGAGGEYEDVCGSVLSGSARQVLEARVEEEEQLLKEGGALCSYSAHLKRKRYSEAEREKKKFPRRDLIEKERLRKLREEEDANKAAGEKTPAAAAGSS